MGQHGMVQSREQMVQHMISKVGNSQNGLVAEFLAIDYGVNGVQSPIKALSAIEIEFYESIEGNGSFEWLTELRRGHAKRLGGGDLPR